jgi:hypothetical protein
VLRITAQDLEKNESFCFVTPFCWSINENMLQKMVTLEQNVSPFLYICFVASIHCISVSWYYRRYTSALNK